MRISKIYMQETLQVSLLAADERGFLIRIHLRSSVADK